MPKEGSINRTVTSTVNEDLYVQVRNRESERRIGVFHVNYGVMSEAVAPDPFRFASLQIYQNREYQANLYGTIAPNEAQQSDLIYYSGVDSYGSQIIDFGSRPLYVEPGASLLVVFPAMFSSLLSQRMFLTVLADFLPIEDINLYGGWKLR